MVFAVNRKSIRTTAQVTHFECQLRPHNAVQRSAVNEIELINYIRYRDMDMDHVLFIVRVNIDSTRLASVINSELCKHLRSWIYSSCLIWIQLVSLLIRQLWKLIMFMYLIYCDWHERAVADMAVLIWWIVFVLLNTVKSSLKLIDKWAKYRSIDKLMRNLK